MVHGSSSIPPRPLYLHDIKSTETCSPPLSPHLLSFGRAPLFLSNELLCTYHTLNRTVPFLIFISPNLKYYVLHFYSRLVRSWVVEHLHTSQTTKHFVNQLSLKYASTPRLWSSWWKLWHTRAASLPSGTYVSQCVTTLIIALEEFKLTGCKLSVCQLLFIVRLICW